MDAIVYTREGCHLCDVAIVQLREAGFNPVLVDVDMDPERLAQFGTCVPVVEIEGKIRFRGRVNRVLLQRLKSHLRTENREEEC